MRTVSKIGREVQSIVVVYALFGSAWIYLSDSFLSLLISDPATRAHIEVFKGLFFIIFTSALLFQLIGRFARRNSETIRQLAESEARFQAIYHNVNDALFIQDPTTGHIVDVNRTMCSMFGYTSGEALQLQVQELSTGLPPYTDSEARLRLDLAARGIPQMFEWHSKKKDGTVFWTEVNMRSAVINGTERIIVMVRDIVARKEAEEALRQNEEILKVLMEEMPAGVGWSDEAGMIQYLNEFLKGCLLDWFGCTPAEVPTLDDLMLCALPAPAYRAKIQESWKGAIAEARANGGPIPPIEAKFTCRDGSVKHVFLNTRLVYNRILFIFTDITKWESMQSEILKAQKLESLGVLAGGIAHDFNNILTGILGNISFADLLLDGSHQAHRPLKQAEQASIRAAELAHQLLTFAKGGQPVKKMVSVAELVQESLSLTLHGSNVRSVVDIPATLYAIEADEGQMNQAFNNVIINALQAMPDGGTLSIKGENVTLGDHNGASLAAGDYVRLSFSDQGAGIAPEDQQRIFDPYFTTKAGGTGLGLASVHSIVSRHNGKIEVDSTLGKGTTFTFYLPSTQEASPEPESPPVPRLCILNRGEGAILVMDDEESIRSLTTNILEFLGYTVGTCSTGEEAVRLYKEAVEAGTPFLAAIMDLTVPTGMGGKEAAKQILAYDPYARLIVSSGYSNDPVMARHAEYGFCAAVVKPYRAVELQEALERSRGLSARG
ncbi:MAG TPA: hybrid sensor histidine kinase/response regulator [Geobacter sp.]|nr:hybrid sensor histidine kinase/response regulator [Geobacter sp.]